MHRSAFYIVCYLLVGSCNFFTSPQDKNEKPIARVYDKYLYESDIAGMGKGAIRPEDSIQAIHNYIDSWIRHNLMLRYAQDNLPDEEQRLNDRLRDYKESLLIYQYENDLVNQKLDTSVSEEEVEKYYSDHQDIFSLKKEIVRVKYIILPKNTSEPLDSVKAWIRNMNDYNRPKLLGFCREYAVRYSIGDSMWYNKEELTALLPADNFNFENAEFNRSYVETADSGYRYLIKFDDYRIKGSDAPIDFVKNEIINIILNQRKMAFVGRIHKNIYDDGLKNGDFEVYGEERKTK